VNVSGPGHHGIPGAGVELSDAPSPACQDLSPPGRPETARSPPNSATGDLRLTWRIGRPSSDIPVNLPPGHQPAAKFADLQQGLPLGEAARSRPSKPARSRDLRRCRELVTFATAASATAVGGTATDGVFRSFEH
jgi:hypothetical protein